MQVTHPKWTRRLRLQSWLVVLSLGLPSPGVGQPGGRAVCRMDATPLTFGNYLGDRSSPLDVTATISVTCTPIAGQASTSVSFTIALMESNPAGHRELHGGRETMLYALYADAGRSLILGDGTAGTTTLSGGGAATQLVPLRQSFTVHGRILARQRRATAGAYADTLSLQLKW